MNPKPHKTLSFLLAIFSLDWAGVSIAATTNSWHLEAGPLTLEIQVSKTAHLFHVVDQISQWSEFCHRQYARYFEALDGGLNTADRERLAQHAALRKAHGWGGGLEQTIYTAVDLETALAQGVQAGWLTESEAQTERGVLEHFQPRIERLLSEERTALDAFGKQLSGQRTNLIAMAQTLSRFVGGAKITVPGLEAETLSEGLAYAFNPGLVRAGTDDPLLTTVAGYLAQGLTLKDSYPRFNLYGLALRPLLKEALSDPRQTVETFLPRAVDAWRVLTEIDRARGIAPKSPLKARDDHQPSKHSIFIFGLWDDEANQAISEANQRNLNLFGRLHVAEEYHAMLTKNAKPGDCIILLLSLDDDQARVPAAFADLLPAPWEEVERSLKQGRLVFQQGKAREMAVFLLAAPTTEGWRKEFRQLAAENKFQP